jgi:hypothetical protein
VQPAGTLLQNYTLVDLVCLVHLVALVEDHSEISGNQSSGFIEKSQYHL